MHIRYIIIQLYTALLHDVCVPKHFHDVQCPAQLCHDICLDYSIQKYGRLELKVQGLGFRAQLNMTMCLVMYFFKI